MTTKPGIQFEFKFLHMFRGLAAFWVLTGHCLIWGNWYGIPLPYPTIAVDLFMMISGFLMAATTEARNETEPISCMRNIVRFWLKRYFRIAPAYYLTLILAIVLSYPFLRGYADLQALNPSRWPHGGTYDPSQIHFSVTSVLLHISFLFGLFPKYASSTMLPDWSLSLEMQFYALFPVLVLFMRRFGYLAVSLSIGVLSLFAAHYISRNWVYPEPSLLFLKINYFLAGIILHRVLTATISKKDKAMSLILAILLVSLTNNYGKQSILPPLLLLALYISGRLEISRTESTLVSKMASHKITVFASEVSYSVYLLHGFFLSAFGLVLASSPPLLLLRPFQRVFIMWIFVTCTTYAVAGIVRKYIEIPGIRIGRSFIENKFPKCKLGN